LPAAAGDARQEPAITSTKTVQASATPVTEGNQAPTSHAVETNTVLEIRVLGGLQATGNPAEASIAETASDIVPTASRRQQIHKSFVSKNDRKRNAEAVLIGSVVRRFVLFAQPTHG
jgi:hypothetical protein